jgi:hypothetical protein
VLAPRRAVLREGLTAAQSRAGLGSEWNAGPSRHEGTARPSQLTWTDRPADLPTPRTVEEHSPAHSSGCHHWALYHQAGDR